MLRIWPQLLVKTRQTCRRLAWQWRGMLLATPITALTVIALRYSGLLQFFELAALDQMFWLRSPEAADQRVVIIDITEEDVRNSQRWPISDQELAALLNKLRNSRVVGLDIYRNFPVEPGHQELVQTMRSMPNLFGIRKVTGNLGDRVDAPPALPYPDRVGANDLIVDADGKVRRFFLSIPVYEGGKAVGSLDGLGVKLALRYLADRGINPEVVNPDTFHYRLGQLELRPFQGNDGGYVHANDQGYQLILNYRHGRFRRITMGDLLTGNFDPDLLRDRVVLIGASAVSLNDLYLTPFSSVLVGVPQRMPGVEIHAQITSQIIAGALGERALLTSWPEEREIIWIWLGAGLGAGLTWFQRNARGQGWRSLWPAGSLGLAAIALVGVGYGYFQAGVWIPVVPPLLALGGAAFGVTMYVAKTAGDIRATFGRYLTDDVVANLLENPDGAKLGGERRRITILTCDLRGFTAIAERLPPEEVVKILNLYLGKMADVIGDFQGTIDEFMGDGILVLFGAPVQREDDPQRAVACAVAMQSAIQSINATIREWGLPDLKMGVGINTGDVVVGNIGSQRRTKYGVVGSQVNLTYRIESYTTDGQIFISQSTYEAVPEVVIDQIRQVNPKGVKGMINIYSVRGIGGKYNLSIPDRPGEVLCSLTSPLEIHYSLLEGKDVSQDLCPAQVVKLSKHAAQVRSDRPVNLLANLKLNLILPDEPELAHEDIYAKVTEQGPEADIFHIHFTAIPPKILPKLEQLTAQLG